MISNTNGPQLSIIFFFMGLSLSQVPAIADNEKNKLPIIYRDDYNIRFWGIQKLHAFDTEKYGRVYRYLVEHLPLTPKHFIKPPQASQQELRLVHTDEYLQTLRSAKTVARIAELPLLSYLPDGMLYRRVIVPMEYATGGTLLGIELALEHFWAINLSGGYHHAKASAGEGFCYISDIAVAISKKWQDDKNLRVLIIDLDAHQGNGIASIFRGDRRVDILDIYNSMIYPRDIEAQSYITYGYPLSAGTQDQDYLATLRKALSAMEGKSYDLIIYNAGTDILKGDPLGRLAVSQEGVIKRDELVFSWARKKGIPILMLLSGGYTSRSGLVIGRSIVNLWQKSLLLQ